MSTRTLRQGGLLAASAITAALAMAAMTPAQASDMEKCYGVAKAGKNDCASAGNNSCAGTAKADAEGKAWILVPKGTCDKLVGGSLEPKA